MSLLTDNIRCKFGFHPKEFWYKDDRCPSGISWRCSNCGKLVKYEPPDAEANQKTTDNACDEWKKEKTIFYENRLTIFFQDGSSSYWWLNYTQTPSIIKPWAKFYKWFYSKTSPYYSIESQRGVTVIRRVDIKRINIDIIDKDV